jgi:hypothetical protein
MRNKGRQIDYETLMTAKNKVNLGCKCSPNLKMTLAKEALKYGMTLSEYVEILVSDRNLDTKMQEENQALKNKLSFYENEKLQAVYLKNKGTKSSFFNDLGKEEFIFIESIQDAYTAIINLVENKS